MDEIKEPKTVGLTSETQTLLRKLKDDLYFREMQDGYKFAVGLAIASDGMSPPLKSTVTMFGSGDLDPDRSMYEAVKTLKIGSNDEAIYKTIERLAEWGVVELYSQSEYGDIDFAAIMTKVKNASK